MADGYAAALSNNPVSAAATGAAPHSAFPLNPPALVVVSFVHLRVQNGRADAPRVPALAMLAGETPIAPARRRGLPPPAHSLSARPRILPLPQSSPQTLSRYRTPAPPSPHPGRSPASDS